MSDKEISRRDFIKGTVAAIGGLIGTVIALPTIAYLLSPAMTEQEDTDSIDLGPLENYPIDVPTRCLVCDCLPPAVGQPYTGSFDWKDVPAGTYRIVAVAYAGSNDVFESEPVTIRVLEGSPTPRITITAPGAPRSNSLQAQNTW